MVSLQFISRTTTNISEPLKTLEVHIHEKLLPALLPAQDISDDLRKVFSLPIRMGGLGIQNPALVSAAEYENSVLVTRQLADAIFVQDSKLEMNENERLTAVSTVKKRREVFFGSLSSEIQDECSELLCWLLKLSSEKGASAWLSTLPLKELGFRMNKQQFEDALVFAISTANEKCASEMCMRSQFHNGTLPFMQEWRLRALATQLSERYRARSSEGSL